MEANEQKRAPLAAQKAAIEEKLQKHNNLEAELREWNQCRYEIKDKKDDLVEKAREKITESEAKALILARWQRILDDTVLVYVRQYRQEFQKRLETLWSKYNTTLKTIQSEREKEAELLNEFLVELGYDSD